MTGPNPDDFEMRRPESLSNTIFGVAGMVPICASCIQIIHTMAGWWVSLRNQTDWLMRRRFPTATSAKTPANGPGF
jgi:hypothetical protein